MIGFAARTIAEMSAYEYGRAFGKIFWAAVLLLVISKTGKAFARGDTNKKSAVGLILVLAGWLTLLVFSGSTDQSSIVMAGAAVAGLLIVVGMILAIVSLVEEPRPGVVKGRGLAVWAMCLGFLVVGSFAYGFHSASLKARITPPGATEVAPGETLVFEDGNFRLTLPGRPWVKLDPARINPQCSVVLMRSRPNMSFTVIAERVPSGVAMSQEAFVSLVKGTLESGSDEMKVLSEGPSAIAGMKGALLRSDTRQGNLRLSFAHWVYCRNGFFYQLACSTDPGNAARVEPTLREFVAGFSQIDPDAEAFKGVRIAPYRSERYGYSVDLSGTEWVVWEDLESDAPEADFGAVMGQHAAFIVVPVRLSGLNVSLESVAYALLQCMEIEYPNKGITDLKRVDTEVATGYDFRFGRRMDDDDYIYRFRVIVRGGDAFLVAGWIDKAAESAHERIDEAVGAVDIDAKSPASSDENALSELEARRHGMVINDIGIYYDNARNVSRAAECWRVAARHAPKDEVIVSNYVYGLQQMGRSHEALKALDSRIGGFPDSQDLLATRASLLADLGRDREAIDALAAVFKSGYQDDDRFTLYGNLLIRANEVERAIKETERYLERSESVGVVTLLANLHGMAGDRAKAIRILRERMKGRPLNAELMYALADHQGEAGLHHEAIKTCDRLMAAGHDTPSAHYLKGHSLYALKWYREAKEAFERAHNLAPGDAEIKEYLDAAAGMLGQGENLSVRTPIEPVEAPRELFAAHRPDNKRLEGYRSYFLWRVDAISYRAGEELRRTTYRSFKVLTNSAVSEYGTFQVRFDPLGEEVYVNSLTVKDADGATVATGNVDDYYVVDDTSSWLATQDKILHLPIRGLAPGRTVEAVVTRRDLGEIGPFRFFERLMSMGVPVVRSAVHVSGDVDAVAHLASDDVEVKRSEKGLTFVAAYPRVYRPEPLAGDLQGFLPLVRLGDRSRTWRAEVKEYLGELKEVLAAGGEVDALAAEVFADADGAEEKMLAAVRHVRSQYAYKGIEFGRRASVPRHVTDVIDSKYGDCKDHSLLLVHLLRSAGMDARLALVNASGPVAPELADIDQFDHMIAYVPGGGRFIDCTGKYMPASSPVPLGLGGRRALVLDASLEEPLVRVPPYPQDADRVHVEREVTVEGDALLVEERVAATDYYASFIRRWLASHDLANRRGRIKMLLTAAHVPAKIDRLDVDGLEDPDRPLRIRITYRVPKAVRWAGKRGAVRVAFGWEREYLSIDHVAERLAPMTVAFPLNWSLTARVRPPDGMSLGVPVMPVRGGDARFARWSLAHEATDGGLTIRFESAWRAGDYSVADFGAFQAMAAQALDALCTEIPITSAE